MSTPVEYRKRADQHRPTDEKAIAETIRELAGTGLKPHDIASVLRLGVGAVLQSLREQA